MIIWKKKANNTFDSPPETFPVVEKADAEVFIRQIIKIDASMGCNQIYQRYYAMLCNHVLRFVYSKEVAEDIVSEVFYKFWAEQYYLRVTTSYRAYLFCAVRNEAINYLKKEIGKKHVDITSLQDEMSHTHDPFQIMKLTDLSKIIERTISELPEKCRLVFLMSRLEGKKNLQIAAELAITDKAIEKHISKALKRLKVAINKEYL